MSGWADMVLVGRIARPHGLRGAVVINPETDFAAERFAVGSRLTLGGPGAVAGAPRTVVVETMRLQQGRPIVQFEGFGSIEAVQGLAGAEIRVEPDTLAALADGEYYHHELIGCVVETAGGARVGTVSAVEGSGAMSRLIVDGPRGELQVPFAVEICGVVDLKARRIVITPPEGLLELNG
ncbi:MAG: ribosome maturation factor RimM [Vicinamibacterales bacterium]